MHYLLMILVLLLVAAIRIRLLDVPLERDEGEFAYIGQLLLKGIPPFQLAYSMKFPGVSFFYAGFMFIFGQTPFGIHLGLLIVNVIATGLVWLLGRRLFDMQTATYAAMIYALLSLSQGVFGVFAHATHFVNLFVLAGFLLLFHYRDYRRTFLVVSSGICFGLAVTMKQHAIVLVVFAFLYLLWNAHRHGCSVQRLLADSFLFLVGTMVPLAGMFSWMAITGVFGKFWFWTFDYARTYAVSGLPLANGLSFFKSQITAIATFQPQLWLSAIFGLALLLVRRKRTNDQLFVPLFLFFALLALSPGFHFRKHYFILMLAPISLLSAFAVSEIANLLPNRISPWLRQALPILLLFAMVSFGFYNERKYFFAYSPPEVSRSTFGGNRNPFPETLEIASYIKEHCAPDDRIAVLGSEPQIYFYADKLSATGHIYMYNLLEQHPFSDKMKHELISEIETHRPLYLVIVDVRASWQKNPYYIMQWANSYAAKHYQLAGIIDMDREITNYLWDDRVVGYVPRSESVITVWKRNTI